MLGILKFLFLITIVILLSLKQIHIYYIELNGKHTIFHIRIANITIFNWVYQQLKLYTQYH